MKNFTALAWIAVVTGFAVAPAAAAGLDCGKPPAPDQKTDTVLSGAINSPNLDARGRAALASAVQRLKGEGVLRPFIVDHAVAAYCPLVAKDDSLSLDRKREAVRRFAAELTSMVYDSLDPTEQADTAVILSVPLKPALSEQVDIAAAKAGQTREAWVQQAIQARLTGG